MKKKVIFGIVAAAVLAIGTVFVVAQKSGRAGGPGFGPGRGGHMAGMLLRGLDLTDEQKAKVKEIMEAGKTTVEPLMQQLKENRAKLHEIGTNGTFDQAAVEALAAEQGNTTAKLIVERAKVKAQVFALLTDEQKAKAAEMKQKFGDGMKEHRGFGGKRGGSEF